MGSGCWLCLSSAASRELWQRFVSVEEAVERSLCPDNSPGASSVPCRTGCGNSLTQRMHRLFLSSLCCNS